MERWVGKVALVTGASVGIGAAICKTLVTHGLTVVGCDVNEEQLRKLAAEMTGSRGKMVPLRCDLEKSDQIEELFRTIDERYRGVDVCVNNAGVNINETLLEGKVDDWRTILNVNVLAVAHCSQLAILSMRKRSVQQGQIINMSSLAGHIVPPRSDLHFYTASKHAVTALTEGLRQELAGLGTPEAPNRIRIAQISPGLVKTQLATSSPGPNPSEQAKKLIQRVLDTAIDASQIGDAVVYILSAPQDVQVHDIILRPIAQQV